MWLLAGWPLGPLDKIQQCSVVSVLQGQGLPTLPQERYQKGFCKGPVLLTAASFVQWLSGGQTEASVYQQAEDGKTELSLMHFAITNPGWQPPRESTAFLGFLKEQVQRDGAAAGLAQGGLLPENALFTSIQSLQSESEVRS